MKNIVVLISGNGSNLQALINACQQGRITGNICAVFSNNAGAYGLQRAAAADIPTHTLDTKAWPDRTIFDATLAADIDQYQPSLVVLAGYMRILSPEFIQHYTGRLLNIHPSLLPKYPGLHTHRKAIANGDREHGASVHFVTEQLDSGPVILQAKVPIFGDDSEETVTQRVQALEHDIYPRVVNWFIQGRLKMTENGAWLDGRLLPPKGYTAK